MGCASVKFDDFEEVAVRPKGSGERAADPIGKRKRSRDLADPWENCSQTSAASGKVGRSLSGESLGSGWSDQSEQPMKSPQRTEAPQTIIIFDWDDTLCPSSWANQRCASAEGESEKRNLARLSMQVKSLLSEAKTLGSVVIVTNESRQWVGRTCERLMPKAVAELQGVRVIYGMELLTDAEKETYGRPDLLREAKTRAVQVAASGLQNQFCRNIVTIGDACYEHDAIRQEVRSGVFAPPQCCTKNIRLSERGSVSCLRMQLSILKCWLRKIVDVNNDVNIDLKSSLECEGQDCVNKILESQLESGHGARSLIGA